MKFELNTISHNLDDILDRYKPLTDDEEKQMIISCGNDIETRNHLLVLHNLAFAVGYVKKYHEKSEEREDFIMRGVQGLCSAAESFDPDKGMRFCTYAMYHIQKAMRDLFNPALTSVKTQAGTSVIFDAPTDRHNEDAATIGDYLVNNSKPADWNPMTPDSCCYYAPR